jgi:PKD repeat protein
MIAFLLTYGLVFGQTAEEIVLQETQIEELKKFEERVKVEFETNRNKAIALAEENGWEVIIDNPDGSYMELVGVDEFGGPIYYSTDNRNSARTIATSKVHNGGGAGYNLEGQGMTLGIWDGGAVLRTHREFGNRVLVRDGTSGSNYHATHVGGTMVASGVSSSAKGMAPQANLWSYNWTSDSYEMSQASRNSSNPLLVSCHSYGTPSGFSYSGGRWYWYGTESISMTEDYKFGFYDSKARDWDQLARLAPYYLICKSAGNDRNDYTGGSHLVWRNGRWTSTSTSRKRDGDYNSIAMNGNAKNIMTVGAVDDISNGYTNPSSVRMSTFSCWGPTDDGRIKPDIVANGVTLYSTYNTNTSSYNTSSGTSMSTPSVAGSLILLQQHYKARNNRYMRSATLKGLVIHTADEAGSNIGPDYTYGWGLMNTRRAADVISNSKIDILEQSLANRAKYIKNVAADGTTPLRITICWTDYEGIPTTAQLNPTQLMLRNDLDVRLIHDNGTIYKPYVLNPSLPAAAPTKGDNFRDNVEQIYIGNPVSGGYRIEVSHKGSLVGSSQPFSIIIEGFTDKPVASFTKDKNSVCLGDTVFYTNTSQGNFNSVKWDFSGGHISTSTASNPYVIYDSIGTFSTKLTVSNGSVSDDITSIITVRENPNAEIINDSVFCLPIAGNRQIFAKQNGGIWNGPGWMFRTDSCIFKPNSVGQGDYPLLYNYTDAFGCSGEDSTTVKIRRRPRVNLNLGNNVVCNNASPFALSGGTPTGGTYWVNGVRATTFDPSIYQPGFVSVEYSYSDADGCSDSREAFYNVEVCGGIEDLNELSIDVFPNPVRDVVHVRFNEEKFEKIRLLDTRGKEIEQIKITGAEEIIEVSELPNGVYILELSSPKHMVRYRLVKN